MRIHIDPSRCTGCRMCQVACSLKHTESVNPRRSRIRVYVADELCIPVIAGPYTEAACNSKGTYFINGIEVDGCVVCRASCPAKSVFKEPGTGIPLKCDFCGDPPDPECVKWCAPGALSIEDD